MKDIQLKVVHKIPGRLRIHVQLVSLTREQKIQMSQAIIAVKGVEHVEINTLTGSVLTVHQNVCDITSRIFEIIQFYLPELKEKKSNDNLTSNTLIKRLVLSSATLLIHNGLGLSRFALFGRAFTLPGIVSLFLSVPLLKSAIVGTIKAKLPNANFLTISSIVASLLLGQSSSALTIIMLSDIAELMTTYTIERTRKSIKNLLSVDEDHAWLVKDNGELERAPVKDVRINDLVVVHTGEKMTVDGVIVNGSALVDQSSTTGEFLPIVCNEGSEVFAGSIVKSGVVTIKTLKVGDDTVVSRIVNMVENVASQQAPIQNYADRFSNLLAPLNFLIAGMVFCITKNAEKALKMLVIDYSCGIKLSTATAFSAAIHSGVKQGILIKGGAYLEKLSEANTVIFDKTGTITEGRPKITKTWLVNENITEKELLTYACAAEKTSMHPLAEAVLSYGNDLNIEMPAHGEIQTVVARGTQTTVDGKIVRVGNLRFMQENNISVSLNEIRFAKKGIPLFVSLDETLLGILLAEDQPRANIRRAFNQLRQKGFNEIVIMTGDTAQQASQIAQRVGADSFEAELLPEDKADAVLKFQSDGHHVVMVGDGINDAPALAYADVGISLGSKSTDVAMETSDIIIGKNDPMLIPKIREIAENTMSIVKQNFCLVIVINTLGLVAGATSNMSVFVSALLHNTSTIIVVANSVRLLLGKKEKK